MRVQEHLRNDRHQRATAERSEAEGGRANQPDLAIFLRADLETEHGSPALSFDPTYSLLQHGVVYLVEEASLYGRTVSDRAGKGQQWADRHG